MALDSGYQGAIKIYIAGPVLCDSDFIGVGLWLRCQSFKSSLGDSKAYPRWRTTTPN